MATKSEIKKQQIEAILGEKLSDEALGLIFLVQNIAISTNDPSRTTQKSVLVNSPNNRCVDSRTLDVSGFAQTLGNGQNVLRLSNFLCPAGERFSFPINIVATPISSKPFFMTVIGTLINNGEDVEMKFFSWDANGAAAPSISFNWRCRVELQNFIL